MYTYRGVEDLFLHFNNLFLFLQSLLALKFPPSFHGQYIFAQYNLVKCLGLTGKSWEQLCFNVKSSSVYNYIVNIQHCLFCYFWCLICPHRFILPTIKTWPWNPSIFSHVISTNMVKTNSPTKAHFFLKSPLTHLSDEIIEFSKAFDGASNISPVSVILWGMCLEPGQQCHILIDTTCGCQDQFCQARDQINKCGLRKLVCVQ